MSYWSIASRYRRCVDALRRDLPAAGRSARTLEEILLQLDVGILRDELRGRLHVAAGKPVPLAQQVAQLAERALGARRIFGRAFDHDVVSARLQRTPSADSRLRRFSSNDPNNVSMPSSGIVMRRTTEAGIP